MSKQVGKVYLLGAGPGDPGLITCKALRLLEEADVVLHDALIHPELLRHCKTGAQVRFVGKRGGDPKNRQSSINEALIDEARAGHTVVRLKGGDPFLFGRGSEEAEALGAAGIPFEVVPGVPSPMAATAYAGISLTHRELSSSVAYVTATESPEKDRSAHDWAKLATATQTLVLFMGMRKLDVLMQLLMEHGRAADTPAAVVQSASLPSQRTIIGQVSTIAKLAQDANIGMPALTIVGDVVSLRHRLRWYDRKALFGKRIWVTRMSHQASDFSALLRDAGAMPLEAATIVLESLAQSAQVRAAIKTLEDYRWVLFTSANGVHCFFEALQNEGLDARAFGHGKIATIGPATAMALKHYGLRADITPQEYVAESLTEALLASDSKGLKGAKVLIARAQSARDVLPKTLKEAGATVDVLAVYRTKQPTEEAIQELKQSIVNRQVDAVTFTSSSTVEHAVQLLGNEAKDLLSQLVIACIGPITAQTAKNMGLKVDVQAKVTRLLG
ncbi:MAG: uroporphyrinogen-III C-methyltransferase [Myxococcales bacterium]|nr:MAG: uroporphyrinogen-III C-methyltransferase [Myxococcales bacterium]